MMTPTETVISQDPLSDEEVVARVLAGETSMFEIVMRRYNQLLYRVARSILRNDSEAEDVMQDAYVRAYEHLNQFAGKAKFSTWLTRIVMNSALMIRRKNRNARQVSADDLGPEGQPALHLQIPDLAPNPEQSYVERERTTILRHAIGKLRPRIRAVVEIAQLQELPLRETARVLDISVAAAKGRFFHARAALRRSAALRAVAQARTEPAA